MAYPTDHLKSLEAHVFDFNIGSQKALIKAGFTPVERVPALYKKGRKTIDGIKFVMML